MPPDLWFDPSGGGFGVSSTPGSGTPSNFYNGLYFWVGSPLGSQPGHLCFSTSPTPGPGLGPLGIDPNFPPDMSMFVPCPASGDTLPSGLGGSGGGATLPAGLGSGGVEIQPPTSGSTCPQCGCVTCQCQTQPSETPQRSCYLLPNGQYVWLTQNDEVPSNATPCSGITQLPPEQPETATPTETIAIEPVEQSGVPAPACITQFPFGSPDWCKCAETWRAKFQDLGLRLLTAIGSDEFEANGIQLNLFAMFDLFVPTGPSITGNLDQLAVVGWLRLAWLRVLDLYTQAFDVQSAELLGLEYMRNVIDCAESTTFSTSIDENKDDHQSAGVTIFNIGTGFGEKDSQDRSLGGSIHFLFKEIRRALDQLAKFFAPITPASIGDGLSIFLAGGIDLAGLQCVFAANGIHPGWAEPTALAAREKPQPLDWIQFWRRGKISDQQLATALRGRGYLLPDEQQVLVTVSEVIPPPTDLVRFMLRSIGDPNIVQRFQLEDEFDQLFQGRIKDWAKANGISEDVLRGYHAAHWVVPGPGDLSVFWQRFGEDRQSPQANALLHKMSRQDYDRALREQGIAPFWRPFFVAAQYTVANKRDLQYAYQIGAYSQTELLDGLLDIGYSPSVAPRVKKIILSRAVDAWTKDPVVSAYKKNGINQTALLAYLQDRGCPQEVQTEVLRIIRIEATEIANEEFVKLLEKQYELGGLTDQDFASELLALGFDQDQIERLVLLSRNQKEARPKQIPAAELCRFYGGLLISRSEFLARLVALNYTPNDAELIVAKCELDLEAKQIKQLQMLMKQQAAAERRQLKDLSQQERQNQLAKARDAKALASRIRAARQAALALEREQARETAVAERSASKRLSKAKAAETEELRIQTLVSSIAERWSKHTGQDPVAAATDLVAAAQSVTADGTYTIMEVLRVVLQRLESGTKDYPPLLSDLVSSLLPLIAQTTAIAPERLTNGEAPFQPTELTSQ